MGLLYMSQKGPMDVKGMLDFVEDFFLGKLKFQGLHSSLTGLVVLVNLTTHSHQTQ